MLWLGCHRRVRAQKSPVVQLFRAQSLQRFLDMTFRPELRREYVAQHAAQHILFAIPAGTSCRGSAEGSAPEITVQLAIFEHALVYGSRAIACRPPLNADKYRRQIPKVFKKNSR